MPINVNQFAGVVPSGNFFSDVRLPLGASSSGPLYAPALRRTGTTTGTGTFTGAPSMPAVPQLPDYSEIDDLIAQINAGNQAAQHSANLGRIPGAANLEAQSSQTIADLFDPDANLPSINMDAAAAAVGSGTVGSPFAGVTGLRRRDDEITRRQALAQQMLGGAYARNPAAAIADPMAALSLLANQRFTAGESAADRALRRDLARQEQQTALAIAAMRDSGRYGTGGGGSYGPRLPSSYGRPAAAPAATFRAGIPEMTAGGVSFSGREPPSLPEGAYPENWFNLPWETQADYAAHVAANPYFGAPEFVNPYSDEYDPGLAFALDYETGY